MKIQTGSGTISLVTLLALWSISAVISLPGLAITPILGDLDKIFPHAGDLEIQMLTSLPSVLIIPFILLSGRLSVGVGKVKILVIGLSLFLGSGILYFFARSMTELIVVSCLLGVGAGMMIPMATGMIADFFTGKYRVQQLGMSSAINNLTLVLATALTGYLANINWHLPFLVYLLPAVPLLLARYLRSGETKADAVRKQAAKGRDAKLTRTDKVHLGELMWLHFFITYAALTITFYLPFLLQDYHMNSDRTGVLISMLFLAIMSVGFVLNKLLYVFKSYANIVALFGIAAGLLLIYFFRGAVPMGIGCLLAGFGYGIMQPVIYDKAANTSSRLATLALAFVMSVNNLAIVTCPLIVDLLRHIAGTGSDRFPFAMNAVFTLLMAVYALWRRRESFSLGMTPGYYQRQPAKS